MNSTKEGDFVPVKLTRRQETTKFFQFVFFSISAGLIQVLVFTLLKVVLERSYWASYLPALIASVLWNFTINRKFTFKSVSSVPTAMMKIAVYYLIFTPLSTWWGDTLNGLRPGINLVAWSYIVLISTMLINFVTEFGVYRFWIYRSSINSSKAGQREQEKYAHYLSGH